MICMKHDCHIFCDKCPVLQVGNLVLQTKHLVFHPEILDFDQNIWSSFKSITLKY